LYIYSKLQRFDRLELRNPGLRILPTILHHLKKDRDKIEKMKIKR